MILAAGRGERMGTLTQHTPKPLLRVNGKYLIEYALHRIKEADIHEVIINIFYHADQIKLALGDGKRYGLSIIYSEEKECLETGGGILHAMPYLGDEPFLVMSSDIITDYPLSHLRDKRNGLAHLLMVKNPSYHLQGDFGIVDGKIDINSKPTLTFASIGVYHPQLFTTCQLKQFRLTHVLIPAIQSHQVTGEYYDGLWANIGTPEDLEKINLMTAERTLLMTS